MEEENNNKGFKIFIIVIIIGFLFLFKKENKEKIIGIINSITNKEKALVLIESFPKGDTLDVNIYDDNVVKWTDNKLSFLNIDGTKIVEKEFSFIDPYIYFGKDNIYPMDKSTGDIYILDKKGETIDRLELNNEIFNFEEINQNMIYHGKSNDIEELNILDKNKIQVGNYSYETENILRYTINKSGTKFIIGLIDLNQESISSRIDCYGEDNEKVDEIDIDGEIIVFLGYTSKDEIVVLTDSSIHFINNGEVLWKKELNLIKDIYISDEKIYVLYSNYLETMDFEGNTKAKIGFTEEYKKILPFKNETLVYGNKHMTFVQGKEEIMKKEIEILKLYTSKNRILILGPEELSIYEIISK